MRPIDGDALLEKLAVFGSMENSDKLFLSAVDVVRDLIRAAPTVPADDREGDAPECREQNSRTTS